MSIIGAAADEAAWSEQEEARLVERAKAGSPEAWAEIYERHYRPLFRYALARVQDQALAEDLAATVFLEALKSIDSYTYRGRPLLAWLYRIAHNVVADHRRREGGRWRGLAKEIQSRVPWHFMRSDRGRKTEPRATPSDQAGATENVERLDLKRALDKLGGLQREVIALHYFAGFSLREVAHILGKSERAVYSLQARGLVSLRRHLR